MTEFETWIMSKYEADTCKMRKDYRITIVLLATVILILTLFNSFLVKTAISDKQHSDGYSLCLNQAYGIRGKTLNPSVDVKK